jgi:hypothetical protein
MIEDKFPFPVVDLFAGPGGLGEGFSVLKNYDGSGVSWAGKI